MNHIIEGPALPEYGEPGESGENRVFLCLKQITALLVSGSNQRPLHIPYIARTRTRIVLVLGLLGSWIPDIYVYNSITHFRADRG